MTACTAPVAARPALSGLSHPPTGAMSGGRGCLDPADPAPWCHSPRLQRQRGPQCTRKLCRACSQLPRSAAGLPVAGLQSACSPPVAQAGATHLHLHRLVPKQRSVHWPLSKHTQGSHLPEHGTVCQCAHQLHPSSSHLLLPNKVTQQVCVAQQRSQVTLANQGTAGALHISSYERAKAHQGVTLTTQDSTARAARLPACMLARFLNS